MENTTVVHESIEEATIAELTRQRDRLLVKCGLLASIVREVPRFILSARLDTKQGIETKYDYDRAARALYSPEF